jgi:heme-degrading monooxygenase HmoA
MTAGFVAFHYPQTEHFEEFIGRAHQVREVLLSRSGCLSVEVWATSDDDAVVTMGRFESGEAVSEALTAAASRLGAVVAYDERERKPRQIHMLVAK